MEELPRLHAARIQASDSHGDALEAPGIIVFDEDFSVLWVHRGETLGGYPPIDDLVAKVQELAGSEG